MFRAILNSMNTLENASEIAGVDANEDLEQQFEENIEEDKFGDDPENK